MRHKSTEGFRSTSVPILRKSSVEFVLFSRFKDPDTQIRRIGYIRRDGEITLPLFFFH